MHEFFFSSIFKLIGWDTSVEISPSVPTTKSQIKLDSSRPSREVNCAKVCHFKSESLSQTPALRLKSFRPVNSRRHQQVKVRQKPQSLRWTAAAARNGVAETHSSTLLFLVSANLTFWRAWNSPFPPEAGSSESMCCGLACLRLDMVQPSGAETCKQISSPSSTNSLPWKKKCPWSRNAHVNVIIIINNALRFITRPWQLIGSGPSTHTLFKCAPHWWAGRAGRRGREEAC